MGSLAAFSLGHASADGEVFKCVDADGKTSYQGAPCKTPAETPLKVQAPAPPEASAGARPIPAAPAATPPATRAKTGTGLSTRGPKDRIPTEADFRGPRETWERLRLAIRRGDKDAALKELTPSAQQRLASVFDTIGSKSKPFNAKELGSIRSVMLAGEGLATIKLTRKKADGIYMHDVNLIRDAEGKWRIDNM
ncbi:MAG TPA: DUF4124 domain-containing protein [Xanthobacteraceae bacterium]|nr:DUF4124 domain-containing protein [Xanthobacteraceae bacterium]